MFSKNKEEQKKYQNIITQKLRELLGEYEVDILTEYVWHMAGNAKSTSEFMCNELKDFLGDHTTIFVNWLMKLMNDIKKQKKINEVSSKSEKNHKSSYTKDRQNDELSKYNKGKESRTKQSIIHKRTKGYLKEDDTSKRDFSSVRKRSRSFLSRSSKYSNEDTSFSRRKSKKRQKRGVSIRSNSSSSNMRKFHYDKNKLKTKKTDKSKGDKMKLKDKYKKGDRSTSRSFSHSRVIYVEKEDKKEKKSETFLDNLINRSELELKKKNYNADEYNSNEKKNKAILKPNPRFIGDNPIPYMQPAVPSTNSPDMSNYNMNYTYDNINIQNYEKEINPVGNYYQNSYMMSQQNVLDNNYLSNNTNNNMFNTRYSNNAHQKNINLKMNMNKNLAQTNYMNANRYNNNNYFYQKNNLMGYNIPNIPSNDQVNASNYLKQNASNIRNQQSYYMNTSNKNDLIDNKKNQHKHYIPKTNKQQNFNQTLTNSDKNIKVQQSYFPQKANRNTSPQQNTQNLLLNNDQNNLTNFKFNVESSQMQQSDIDTKEEKTQSVSKTNEIEKQIINTEHADNNTNVIIKIQKKCLFLPNCQYGEKCRYIHPMENCRNWPYCAFGAECIYIHPDVPCKFGIYCCNYYCNYSHKSDNSGALPEIGTNGYFLNKKLINSYDKNINNSNFDDKVAQISISMPKTPPEMRKDKNKNEYIPKLLEIEKEELKQQINGKINNNENVNDTTEKTKENDYEIEDINKEIEEDYILQNNNGNNHYVSDNSITKFNRNGKNNENETANYNCFEIVVDPDNLIEKKLSKEEKIEESINKTENNYEINVLDNKVFTIEDSS